MHILVLGGSLDHPGGVEAFCDRSQEALERQGNWRITRIPTSTAYLSLRRLPNYLKGLSRLIAYRRNRPDCVWLQYVNLPDLTYLVVAKVLGYRVMVTPHLGSNWKSQSVPFLRTLSGLALRCANRLALISPTQELEINLPASVPRSHIRNFLPAEILTAELPGQEGESDRLQLIHSGRLSEGKGSFLVVEVAAKLRDKGVPFIFNITGGADAETYARINELIETHRLESHVKVLGRVPEADLLDLLKQSDVLVHLSKIDSYPLIVLEAMACSMTAVCMDLAGARDMVTTYGGQIVSQEHAVDESADWLASQQLERIRRLGANAATRVRTDYEWSRCAGALAAALKECVGQRGPNPSGSSAAASS
jgi:glycosyltransferase involved in cell wall biosynthesis